MNSVSLAGLVFGVAVLFLGSGLLRAAGVAERSAVSSQSPRGSTKLMALRYLLDLCGVGLPTSVSDVYPQGRGDSACANELQLQVCVFDLQYIEIYFIVRCAFQHTF